MIAQCPSCGKEYLLVDAEAGKIAECACGKTFLLPRPFPPDPAPREATPVETVGGPVEVVPTPTPTPTPAPAAAPAPRAREGGAAVMSNPWAELAVAVREERSEFQIRLGPFPITFSVRAASGGREVGPFIGTLAFTEDEMLFSGVVLPRKHADRRILWGAIFYIVLNLVLVPFGFVAHPAHFGERDDGPAPLMKYRSRFRGVRIRSGGRDRGFCFQSQDGHWLFFASDGAGLASALSEGMHQVFGEQITPLGVEGQAPSWKPVIRAALILGTGVALLVGVAVLILHFTLGTRH
jgi:hypothetical protein